MLYTFIKIHCVKELITSLINIISRRDLHSLQRTINKYIITFYVFYVFNFCRSTSKYNTRLPVSIVLCTLLDRL